MTESDPGEGKTFCKLPAIAGLRLPNMGSSGMAVIVCRATLDLIEHGKSSSWASLSARGDDACRYCREFRPPRLVQCEAPDNERPRGEKHDRSATHGNTRHEYPAATGPEQPLPDALAPHRCWLLIGGGGCLMLGVLMLLGLAGCLAAFSGGVDEVSEDPKSAPSSRTCGWPLARCRMRSGV